MIVSRLVLIEPVYEAGNFWQSRRELGSLQDMATFWISALWGRKLVFDEQSAP